MKLTYEWIKSDPCYGCRFAVPKSDMEIQRDGMFTRRFLCSNMARRDELESAIIRAIRERDFARAMNRLSLLADSMMGEVKGLMKVSDSLVPNCYKKKEEEK